MHSRKLKDSVIETLEHLDPEWFIYSKRGDLFYFTPTYSKVPEGSAVGVKFPGGEQILFKNVFILKHNPKKVKKALDMAQKLNIIDGTSLQTNIDFFYETPIQHESNSNHSKLLP